MGTNRLLHILAVLSFLGPAVPLPALEVPFLAGRVNDLAGLLDEASREQLEQRLAQIEQSTGAQVVVLTIPSLEGEDLEDYAHRVASTWQLGQKGKDNGVLFLIAKGERKMRLEVGYGLESVLPDALARRILDQLVKPAFRAGDFAGGISAGVEAVARAIQGESVPKPAATGPSQDRSMGTKLPFFVVFFTIFILVIGSFSLHALLSTGCQSWVLYLFLLPFWAAFPMALHPLVGIATGLGWLILFPLLKVLLGKTAAGSSMRKALAPLMATAPRRRTWSGGGFAGGFSGGGFSGGGGSFGGGGASSSW
ncbi:MAG: TPM domain-containing protein [Thermoanaerobaculum sp.]|nr:TPM domain-containing protein [Thermoanaerobaculum sp.]